MVIGPWKKDKPPHKTKHLRSQGIFGKLSVIIGDQLNPTYCGKNDILKTETRCLKTSSFGGYFEPPKPKKNLHFHTKTKVQKNSKKFRGHTGTPPWVGDGILPKIRKAVPGHVGPPPEVDLPLKKKEKKEGKKKKKALHCLVWCKKKQSGVFNIILK